MEKDSETLPKLQDHPIQIQIPIQGKPKKKNHDICELVEDYESYLRINDVRCSKVYKRQMNMAILNEIMEKLTGKKTNYKQKKKVMDDMTEFVKKHCACQKQK